MKNYRFIIDFGNTNFKARSDGIETEITIPHAIIEIDPSTWANIQKRNGGTVPEDYACINGSYYAFGEAAERHGAVTKRIGAQKYTEDYFGVGMAYMAARVFKDSANLSVFASHAPGDIEYREDLLNACGDTWEVEIDGKTMTLTVLYANTFEEPIGGLMHLLLTADGKHYKQPKINEGRTLMLDIGGGTVDLAAVLPNGQLDYSLQISLPMGFNMVYNEFVGTFRKRNAKRVKQLQVLPPDRVREAIRTGRFRGAGEEIPCQEEADEASFRLINSIQTAYYQRAGGPFQWDFIGLTGGGPVPLYERLLTVLDHKRVYKAEDDAYMHLANIRGGLKLMYMYENLGLISYD